MHRFLLSRLLQSILVLVLVYAGTFWMLMAVPGKPFAGEKNPPAAILDALNRKYGLDSKPRAFIMYPYQLLTRGDFGPTISYEDQTVADVIKSSLPVSISLGSFALLIALWAGVALGTAGALHKGRPLDLTLTVLTLFGVSLPTFVIASMVLMLFGVYLPVLPTGGWGRISQLFLPALTLALFYLAYIARLTRVAVLDVISQDYVRTARAKGLPPRRIIESHILRNASLPVLSYLGPAAATVLTGSFVVEKVFAIPGLGRDFVNACLNSDIPLVLGSVLVYTTVIVAFNLLVDLAYAALDPRISLVS